jgi:putative salt-induced outer membrane protein YdiY
MSASRANSDTRTFHASLVLAYDPHTRNVVKADAFYILDYQSGASTVDRISAHLRDERELAPRWFAFADVQYLKDRFKVIDYLVAPTAGVGYRLLKSEARQLDVDAGAGAVFERDGSGQRSSDGALRAGEAFTWKMSKTAVLSNRSFAVWKLGGSNDAYYHVDVGLAAAIAEHFELKTALIDEYKRRTPKPTVKRNDVAGIVSIGFKL